MKTHLQSKTRLYKIWAGIKKRCLNKNAQNYYLYGGRKITLCQEWMVFSNFWEWAKINNYKDSLQIDRIDNSGNYEPNNCRWVNIEKNANNKRNNLVLEYKGKKQTLSEILKDNGLLHKYSVIHARITRFGWNINDALTDKPYSKYKTGGIHKNSKIILYKGENYSLIDLCRKLNIEKEYCKIKMRINKLKWSISKAIII